MADTPSTGAGAGDIRLQYALSARMACLPKGMVAVTDLTTYRATATREGRYWVVTVPDVGVTQARTADEAETMATSLVSIVLDVPAESVRIDVEFQLGDELQQEIAAARLAVDRAAAAQQAAAAASRRVVRHILDQGLSQRDAARVLRLSPQRIHQLATSPDRSAGTAAL